MGAVSLTESKMSRRSEKKYKEELKGYQFELYCQGERVVNVNEHPCVAPVINSVGATYNTEVLGIPDELAFAASDSGDKINRHNYIFKTADDAIKRVKLVRELSYKTGACTHRCVGIDAINALDVITKKIDKEFGTEYHIRFESFLKKVQEKDLALAASMTDGKGDRVKKPGDQADPDLFLRVVKKSRAGIIVRGAKAHQSRPMAVDFLFILPGSGLTEEEAEYAVAFALPAGTPGVKMVMSQGPNELFRMGADKGDIGNINYGAHIGNLLIFDDVFIPWERVFLCGETKYVGEMIDIFCRYHRMATGGCKAGLCDVIVGTASMIAEINGLGKASHIREKLIAITTLGETSFGCSIAAAALGDKTDEGNFIPNNIQANIAKLNSANAINQSLIYLQDIAGALAATIPSIKDLNSEFVGQYIRKYFSSENISCEDKFKIFRLAQNLIFGVQGMVALHGGGSPQVQKMAVLFNSNLNEKKQNAKVLAGIQ